MKQWGHGNGTVWECSTDSARGLVLELGRELLSEQTVEMMLALVLVLVLALAWALRLAQVSTGWKGKKTRW